MNMNLTEAGLAEARLMGIEHGTALGHQEELARPRVSVDSTTTCLQTLDKATNTTYQRDLVAHAAKDSQEC